MSFDIMVEKGAVGHPALKTHSRIVWLSTQKAFAYLCATCNVLSSYFV